MNDCIFCQIIAGKIPYHKVYEDNLFLGFLDIKPLNPGNSLLIPKKHYRWVNDVPEFGQYWEIAKKIAMATVPIVKADYVSFLTLGLEIPHAHIRIIPRFYNDDHTHGIDTNLVIDSSNEAMEAISREIITKINSGN